MYEVVILRVREVQPALFVLVGQDVRDETAGDVDVGPVHLPSIVDHFPRGLLQLGRQLLGQERVDVERVGGALDCVHLKKVKVVHKTDDQKKALVRENLGQ